MIHTANLGTLFSKIWHVFTTQWEEKMFILASGGLSDTSEMSGNGSSLLLGFVYQKPVVHKKITSHPICV